ncbi:FG-GAP-like repeat-containing protein [Plantactinospora soyae]|uniref:Endonuclease/exonuclease/phosphatase family metal-dependent hydrolase n=1 Tax=Plantactinospora soyae TaxID=1544732 RepID=A0A927QZH9_9ACTN|nr:FG-GAP-like repeat-containing protein [Plantactinospora soyae]MBE1490425.1 endonuclease/exonuclease/phosphatase family metal-dependent hydrolase [Plantactinospora soyae]
MRGSLRTRWVALLAVGASLLLPVASARADVVDPATAPNIRTLTYNVCGAHAPCQSDRDLASWTRAIKQEIDAWQTDVVMLQELCIGQWTSLRGALTGYRGVWASTVASASRCAKWDAGGDTRFGLGIFIQASTTDRVDRFAAQLDVPDDEEPRGVLCARGPVQGRTTLACTTHLAQYIPPDNGSGQVVALLDRWSAGLPVILGADLNEVPRSAAQASVLTGVPGTGRFAEVDENDRDHFDQACLVAGATACRSGEPTVVINGVEKKFDDIFVTADDFHTVRGDAIEPDLSDHKLLRGAAYAETRSPSGVPGDLTNDGRPDLVAVQNEGNLRLYSGLGAGQLGSSREIGTGGWTNALVAHRGDWTGDDREDLLVRLDDQLWVYPNTGSGDLGNRIAMRGRPTGWAGATAIAADDMDGDGHPDLIVRDASGLWLYRGDPAAPPGLVSTAPVRIGGAEWAQFDPLAPGDATGDGSADLWARDRADGTLWLYPNTGNGSLGTPRPAADRRWPVADSPLVGSLGDITGDGYPDLWATTNAGTDSSLLFHPGTADGLGDPVNVGTGGWQWILRLN